ncbi:MAG: ATP-binding protein, partial [Planctomycetota bacterium]
MPEVAQLGKRTVDRMQVRIEHLDKLLGLAGEVIITSANLHELQRALQERVARGAVLEEEQLDAVKASNEATQRISQELHNLVMDIRLVEIGETFRLFRRPVRDLSRTLGKEVDLRIEGSETLIDKALAERLVDPLLHLLRNAVDHGIEPPLERSRRGKPAVGVVTVQATDREHHTEILVSDDGAGVDEAAVRALAVERALVAAEDETVGALDILTRPGFSTCETVTATSGRGVGLDLVQSVIEEFDGSLAMEATPGQGTRFRLLIPKLRAVNIVDALTVRAGGRLFALPIERIVSSLGVARDDVQTALDRNRFIQYLEEVVVLRDLQELLGDRPLGEGADPLPVVIVQGKAGRVALIVSEFLGPQKLVNVPLDDRTFHVDGVAGTSVFSGGRIGLTLDIDALAARALGVEAAPIRRLRDDAPAAAGGATTKPVSPASGPSATAPAPSAVRAAPGGDAAALDEKDVADLADELRRSLGELQDALLNLEGAGDDHAGPLNEAFRLLHAAKGNLTMLDAADAADAAHQMETLLDFVRSGKLEADPGRMDLLLDGQAALAKAAGALPGPVPAVDPALRTRFAEAIEAAAEPEAGLADEDLIGRAFELSPTVELQVVSALKRGENTFETYLAFRPGRQADFLVAYLILRRIGLHGTVLATLPPVDEIEEGRCGNALKILWSTPLDEAGRDE